MKSLGVKGSEVLQMLSHQTLTFAGNSLKQQAIILQSNGSQCWSSRCSWTKMVPRNLLHPILTTSYRGKLPASNILSVMRLALFSTSLEMRKPDIFFPFTHT